MNQKFIEQLQPQHLKISEQYLFALSDTSQRPAGKNQTQQLTPLSPLCLFILAGEVGGKEGPSVTDSSGKQQKGASLCPGQLEVEWGRDGPCCGSLITL